MAKKKTTKKKAGAAKKAPTKSEIYATISEATEVPRKDVRAVFEVLGDLIAKNLKKSGPQTFTVPGICKIVVKRKPATRARKGINPFTGEETMFKAKPARNIVKMRPLKAVKDMV